MLFSVSLIAGCNSGQDGDPATWTITDGAITSETQQFEALVTRLGCAGGVTGEVLEPDISLGADDVTIEFAVDSISGDQSCPDNDQVAVNIDLGEPIGDRSLVDGACSIREAATTLFCTDEGVRWTPAPPSPDCNGPAAPQRTLDMALVPAPPTARGPDADGRQEFGAQVIEALKPMILGADTETVAATLRGSGWTVTIVELPVTTTTATPDLLWSRLVITTCGGRVEAVAFD
jgi:hypothetical protein